MREDIKSGLITVSIMLGSVVFVVALALFVSSTFGRVEDDSSVENETTEVVSTEIKEDSTEVPSETQSEQVSEETPNNIDNNVSLGIDFKFDTKVSGDFEIFENAIEEEETVLDKSPWLESRIKKEVEGNEGWIYLNSDNLQSVDYGLDVQFFSSYSPLRISVNEVPSSTTYDELKRDVYRELTNIGLVVGEHNIPFGTPYVLGEGLVHPERYYTQAEDGSYGKEGMNAFYQILCEDSIETKIGTVYFTSWYGFYEKCFSLGGYVRNNNGRTFKFRATDVTDQYFVAYISEIFDKCVLLLE